VSSPSYADVPSTAWNVFVASGVAVVVYLGVRMGKVLPAIAAGTILFVGGWMTGYAINQDPPISLPRMLVAGGICGFVIVWTLLLSPGEYVLGGAVVALVSFAAWFTSEMGPIKSETRPTEPIDEPRPPEGPRPGTPLDLGGETESSASSDGTRGSSVLGGLRDMLSPSEADAPEPPESDAPGAAGPSADELHDHPPADEGEDGPTYSTRRTDPEERPGGEKESIFGLGIFYEGEPDPPPAGATTEPSDSGTEPKESDHTRPGANEIDAGEDATDDSEPVRVEVDSDESEEDITEPASADPEEADRVEQPEPAEASPVRRLREPLNSPRRPGQSPEVEASSPTEGGNTAAESTGVDDANATDDREGTADSDTEAAPADAEAETAASEEPPEEHRVEIEDDGGFQFG
jgi:hypothetical protein